MSDPAFLQFAEKFKKQAAEFQDDSSASFMFDANEYAELFMEAERHARLLAAVWEWAKDLTLEEQASVFGMDQDYETGLQTAKAHARALLVQSEEQKR